MDAGTLVLLKEAGLGSYLNESYGWAFFEKVGKGAFIIGVGGGEGDVYRKECPNDPPETATKVGTSTIVLASAGWSLGVEVITEIIFFQTREAFERFTTGKFEFEAGAKARALTRRHTRHRIRIMVSVC